MKQIRHDITENTLNRYRDLAAVCQTIMPVSLRVRTYGQPHILLMFNVKKHVLPLTHSDGLCKKRMNAKSNYVFYHIINVVVFI